MSEVMPRKRADRIRWFNERAGVWVTNAAALGLTSAQAIALADTVEGTVAADDTLYSQKQTLKNAQLDLDASYDAMSSQGAALIKLIKNKAKTNPALYQLAQIPPPSEPTPAPPPDAATEVKLTLLVCGSVQIDWKGSLSGGTFYSIYRQVDSETSLKFVDSIGAKSFKDTTVPAGAKSVTYVVVAKRGSQTGAQSTPVTVKLGCAPQTETVKLKMAA